MNLSYCACVCMCYACAVHVLIQVSAAWGAWGVPRGCLVCAVHGMASRHNLGKVCRTHNHWPKHVKHGQTRVNPSKGTHLSPIQHKNVTRTFCQTPNMKQNTTPMKNAWPWWNMPQYMIRMPHRAKTDTNTINRTQPNQNFEIFFTKIGTPTLFLKIPKLKTLS